MKFGFPGIALLVVIAGAIAGGLFGRFSTASLADSSISPSRLLGDYREAVTTVENNYVSPIDHEKITDSSIQGMLWTLDPHSSFFTRDEFRKLAEEQASEFYGIGVSILQHRDGVYIQSVVPNTPAEKAGLRYGDRFLEVDGKDAREWTSAEVSKNVRGPKGTTVRLKIERPSAPAPLEFSIVRGGVPLPSIRNYFMLPNGVGYVGLTGGFQETTAEELADAMRQLKTQGMTSLVLDLRSNPGGILEQAIAVCSRFLPPNKTVVTIKGRTAYSRPRELKTTGGERDDVPMTVLINGGSASASEIVAGAVQDYGRGLIIGTDSFGKGLVQRVFYLPYGTGLTLTTARYYTPFGRSLQRDYSNGSIYDYYVHHSDEEDEESPETESQPKPAGSPVTLPDGRVLYGGRGIEPDVKILPLQFNAKRARIAEAAFFFVRQLVAGRISGFESYRIERQNQSTDLKPGAFMVNDRLFETFKSFAVNDKENGLTASDIDREADFARLRIRYELATANNSNESGNRVLLESDPQLLKAVEVMPDARKLMEKNFAALLK